MFILEIIISVKWIAKIDDKDNQDNNSNDNDNSINSVCSCLLYILFLFLIPVHLAEFYQLSKWYYGLFMYLIVNV